MSIYPYVYRLDNPLTGEFYIGGRFKPKAPALEDLGKIYFTSSELVKPHFHEFTYHIVAEFFDIDSCFEFEQELIKENFDNPKILNKRHYAKSCAKLFQQIVIISEEQKSKISKTLTGRNLTETTKVKMSLVRKGKTKSEEHKSKIGDVHRGKIVSEETKAKQREAQILRRIRESS